MKFFVLLMCLSGSLMAGVSPAIKSQVYYYGYENTEIVPVRIHVYWNCTKRGFSERSCGEQEIRVVSDKDGKINVPAFRHKKGKHNYYRVRIITPTAHVEIGMKSLNELKNHISKISLYRLEGTNFSIVTKSGMGQEEWLKNIGRDESKIVTSVTTKSLTSNKILTTGLENNYLKYNQPIRFEGGDAILNGDDFGRAVEINVIFKLRNFYLRDAWSNSPVAEINQQLNYPNQLEKEYVFQVDDTLRRGN